MLLCLLLSGWMINERMPLITSTREQEDESSRRHYDEMRNWRHQFVRPEKVLPDKKMTHPASYAPLMREHRLTNAASSLEVHVAKKSLDFAQRI
jgi:hypothetical protein